MDPCALRKAVPALQSLGCNRPQAGVEWRIDKHQIKWLSVARQPIQGVGLHHLCSVQLEPHKRGLDLRSERAIAFDEHTGTSAA